MRRFISDMAAPKRSQDRTDYYRSAEAMGPSFVEEDAGIYRNGPAAPRPTTGAGPWWARQEDDIVLPQRTTVFSDNTNGGVTREVMEQRDYRVKDLTPQDKELYKRYLREARPWDVVGKEQQRDDDRDDLTAWSGRWRPRKDAYVQRTEYHPRQQQVQTRTTEFEQPVYQQGYQPAYQAGFQGYHPGGYERRVVYN